MAEPEEPVPADNTQRVAPKRLECSCTFSKVNTQAEPKSGYHVGTLESGNTKVPGASALGAQSAPATNFVEEKDGAAQGERVLAEARAQLQASAQASVKRDDQTRGNARRFIDKFNRRHSGGNGARRAGEDAEGEDRDHRSGRDQGWVDRPFPVDEDRRRGDSEFIEERDGDREGGGYRGGGGGERDSRGGGDRRGDRDDYRRGRDMYRGERGRGGRDSRRYGDGDEDRDRGSLMEVRQRYPAAPQRGDEEEGGRYERHGAGRREQRDTRYDYDQRDYDGRRDPYEHESRWSEGEFRHYDGYGPSHRR